MNNEFMLFYVFSSFSLVSAIMVIGLSNAVHSVLFLIMVFCNVVGLLLLLGAEFLAFMLLIVYVGAIAVLFLFVIMMLNIKVVTFKSISWSTIPIGLIFFFSFVFQFIAIVDTNFEINVLFQDTQALWTNWVLENNNLTIVEVIGNVLYTKYSFIFLTSGFVLLIAMIGSIVLTLHQRSNVKKQIMNKQLTRNPMGVVKFTTLRK
uniref:NADH-ubiquinone oxidoreductase chain 6 n=1 Tax=Balbiania investiens TaxID=111861 RepID=A0A4D6BLZ6_9FLOR